MVNYRHILSVLVLFIGISLTANAGNSLFPIDNNVVYEQQDNTITFDVIINGTTKIQIEKAPNTGYLEIYSILGVKVRSVNLKNCINGYDMELPKGLYIFKAGKTALKVIVR